MHDKRLVRRAQYEAFAAAVNGGARHVMANCRPDDFDDETPAMRHAMQSVGELLSDGVEITVATVTEHLKRRGLYTPEVITEIENAAETVSSFDAEASARLVSEYAARRRLIVTCTSVSDELMRGEKSASEAAKLLMNKSLSVGRIGGKPSLSMKEALATTDESLRAIRSGEIVGYKTHFKRLDEALMGFQETEVVAFQAAPGNAKSLLVLQILLKNAILDMVPSVFYSLEMGVRQTMNRAIVLHCRKLRNALLLRGSLEQKPDDRMTDEEWEEIQYVKGKLSEYDQYFFVDDSKKDIHSILGDLERRVDENGVKIAAIDYLRLVRAGGDDDSEASRLSKVSEALKAFAMDKKIVILEVMDMTADAIRAAYKGESYAGGARGSSSLTSDPHIILKSKLDNPVLECACGQQDVDPSLIYQINRQTCLRCRQQFRCMRYGNIFVEKARDGGSGFPIPIVQDTRHLRISGLE